MDRATIRKNDILRLKGQGRFLAPGRNPADPTGYVELIEDPAEILYDYGNVRLPLKQVFLPQTELMCEFDFDEITEVPLPEERIVVFGCRPCDARALAQLDLVFGPGYKGHSDPYYLKRRENSVVISLACTEPSAGCFCTATGGGPADTRGADILAHDLGTDDMLLFQALTDRGRALMEAHQELFAEPQPAQVEAARERAAAAEAKVKEANDLGVDLGADVAALKRNMDPLFDDPRWVALTDSCIGCGACTYLCPTCYCFDIADESRLYKGRRIRTWDSCQFAQFTKHASGHNPRTNKKERLRQRFMHKFSYAVENNEDVLCVGCGRCITACPVNLDIRDVIRAFAKGIEREHVS
ncbi:MAG: 4Fe-4S dicluster domain-containing protein [Spirochaetales bacterium]|nr:4Fe-4S dicluster domain-containing protein [Spirochaetales bacterium]